MVSASIWSKYSKLLRGNGDGPPETFANVIEVMDLTAPTNQTELVDVSNFDSPGAFKEWLPTFIDAGELTATVNYIAGNATQQALISDQLTQTTRNFKIEFRNAAATLLATMSFAGYVTGFAITANIREQRKATLKVRVTGAVTIA
jgi:hypothetical protein